MRFIIPSALQGKERQSSPVLPDQGRALSRIDQFDPIVACRIALLDWGYYPETMGEVRYGWGFYKTTNGIEYDLSVNQALREVTLRSRYGGIELSLDGVEAFHLQDIDRTHNENLSFVSKQGIYTITNYGSLHKITLPNGRTLARLNLHHIAYH